MTLKTMNGQIISYLNTNLIIWKRSVYLANNLDMIFLLDQMHILGRTQHRFFFKKDYFKGSPSIIAFSPATPPQSRHPFFSNWETLLD